MTWPKLALVLLQVVNAILKYVNDKRLLAAGESKAIADALTQAQSQVALAMRAADEADAKAGGDPNRVDPAIYEDGK